MDIYFNKGTSCEEVFYEEDILKMTKQEIKNLKARCQSAMGDVALKRNKFRTENDLAPNSPEFWKRMNTYKSVIAIYYNAIAWLGCIEKDAVPPKEQEDREHWLWCYYQESMKVLTDSMVEQIKEMADNRAGYHFEFDKWEYKKEA